MNSHRGEKSEFVVSREGLVTRGVRPLVGTLGGAAEGVSLNYAAGGRTPPCGPSAGDMKDDRPALSLTRVPT